MKIGIFYEHLKAMAREEKCSPEEAMAFAGDEGIRLLDVSFPELAGAPEDFLKKVKAAGLGIGSVYGRVHFQGMKDLPAGKAWIDVLARAEAPNAMVLPMPELMPGENREKALDRLIPALQALGEYAMQKGITLSLENYSAEKYPYSHIADFERIFSKTDQVYFTLDTGNFAFHKEDPMEALSLFGSKISHVHVKSWALPEKGEGQMLEKVDGVSFAAYAAKEGGVVALTPLLKALQKKGYDRALSIEIFGVRPMRHAIRESAAFLRSF